jgi:uncharacterized protein YndB with AHSA1/START domain
LIQAGAELAPLPVSAISCEDAMANRTETDHVAHATTTVAASPERVWTALTDAEQIKQYMFGSTVTSDWKVGSPVTWKGEWNGKPYEDKGTVLRAEPGRLIEYTHFSPLTGEPDIPENYHTVTITLSPEGDGTRVDLAQTRNATEDARKHSEKNWNAMLEGLKKVASS